jgi:hypothetical protein
VGVKVGVSMGEVSLVEVGVGVGVSGDENVTS